MNFRSRVNKLEKKVEAASPEKKQDPCAVSKMMSLKGLEEAEGPEVEALYKKYPNPKDGTMNLALLRALIRFDQENA